MRVLQVLFYLKDLLVERAIYLKSHLTTYLATLWIPVSLQNLGREWYKWKLRMEWKKKSFK